MIFHTQTQKHKNKSIDGQKNNCSQIIRYYINYVRSIQFITENDQI